MVSKTWTRLVDISIIPEWKLGESLRSQVHGAEVQPFCFVMAMS